MEPSRLYSFNKESSKTRAVSSAWKTSKKVIRFANLNVEPGSIIQINQKVESTNLVGQVLTFVEGISNTITQIITTYVIITQIGNVISGNSTQ